MSTISNECQSKGIINKQVHLSILNSHKSRRDKTTDLIQHVWKAIREDDKKCEEFIKLLDKHEACKELVANICRDQREYASVAEENQALHEGTLIVPTRPVRHRKSPRRKSPRQPTECTEGHTSAHNSCMASWLSSESLTQYNTQQEKAQQEARLTSVENVNKKLQAEQKDLQDKQAVIQQERADLEMRLILKDKEMDKVMTERDNLKDSNDILKQRVARAEKKCHVDKELVQQVVLECEEKIKTLKMEKEALKDDFDTVDQKYQYLRDKLELLEGVAEQYEAIIAEINKAEAEQAAVANQQHHYPTCRCHCHRMYEQGSSVCQVAVSVCIVLLLLLGLYIIVVYFGLTEYATL